VIRVTDLTKSFGERILFQDVRWTLGGTERVGLVGANGSGKSTFLRILARLEEKDSGTLEGPPQQDIGYLAQTDFTLVMGLDGSPEEEAWSAFPEIRKLDAELDAIRAGLDSGAARPEELSLQEQEILHRLKLLGRDEATTRVAKTLLGLGFTLESSREPLRKFSSGWQMRAALARLLLQEPAVLLLDEPTNHLDLESRDWLGEYLGSCRGALVVVSHDRSFLDRTVHGITEVLGGRLENYRGGYSDYERQNMERHEQRRKAYERQTQEIKRIKDWINRFRAQKRLASRVQSRIKVLEKMERIVPPEPPPAAIRVRFPDPPKAPRVLCRLEGIGKSFGEKRLFDDLDFEIHRGDRLALVGPNGVGKSTLLRIFSGTESIQSGERWVTPEVTTGFFSHDDIQGWNKRQTVLGMAQAAKPDEGTPRLRSLLGAFLFRGDDIDKTIGALSGGERSRLALACLLLRAPNLLLLDEPTNHLDLASVDALLQALKDYKGTIIFVAHDRYFLNRIANKVAWPSGRRFRLYPGGYEDYLWARAHRPADFDPGQSTPMPQPDAPRGDAPPGDGWRWKTNPGPS
jgi:ATP-binding cassette subfamily F protein 3